jgi:hypothetical protein
MNIPHHQIAKPGLNATKKGTHGMCRSRNRNIQSHKNKAGFDPMLWKEIDQE